MRFSNEFIVQAPTDKAWALLIDVPKIAECLPGASVQDSSGDEFIGTVTIKVGPIRVEYKGTASLTEVEEASRRFVLHARGKEGGGRGSVTADIEVQLRDQGNSTVVEVVTTVDVTGKVAQFGRSAMADVGERLIGQFAANLESMFVGQATPDATEGPVSSEGLNQESNGGIATEMDAMALLLPSLKRMAPTVGAFLVGVLVTLVLRRSPGAAAAEK